MSAPHLNRIAISIPHNIRQVIEAVAKAEGQPVAMVARGMVITAWDVCMQGRDTWWTTVALRSNTVDGQGDPQRPEGPEVCLWRINPIKIQVPAQRAPKRSGAGPGASKRPARSKAGARRRAKGAK